MCSAICLFLFHFFPVNDFIFLFLDEDEDNYRSGKRPHLLFESDGDCEMGEDLLVDKKNDPSFDDLCGEATFFDGNCASSEAQNENWGLLSGHILARVFHFMRSDMKSLISSAATCKRWNLAAKFYRSLCTQIDLSSAGPGCTDSMFWNIMVGYLFRFFFFLWFFNHLLEPSNYSH